jgi:hypothetical protein
MLRMITIAAIFALVAPTLALAEDEHHPGGPPPPHPGGPPPPHPGGPPHPVLKPALKPVFVPHGPVAGPIHPGPAFVPHPGGPPGPPGMAGPAGARFSFHGRDIERVHRDPFVYPPGWAYQRWAVGGLLPPLFLVRDYWYPDWAALGLPPPPPGAEWVRYGPDLLMVDVTSGQVLDVAYDVFY